MTDVAGSTRLWEENRDEMRRTLASLDLLVEEQISRAGGKLVKSRGEGDSHFGVFPSVEGALSAASKIVELLEQWPGPRRVRLRSAVHAGAAETWSGDYYGPVVNRCARIRQAAHPGQILVSESVFVLAKQGEGFGFKDLGVHRLRDLMRPERLFQLTLDGLPANFPPPETLSSVSHNLPAHLTSFVGREREIQSLSDQLLSHRLTTVTGAGGAGKTRLALQVGAERVGLFKDGAWFVDLSQTDRRESILPIVCSVIEPKLEPSEETLFEAIGAQKLLLILDNCEHLFESCRTLVRDLLLRCPNVSVLATSRRTLEVPGEQVFRLAGLELPEPDQIAEGAQFDGIHLFIDRAAERGTGLVVNVSILPGIAGLCRRLDGLPLAIELVASLTDTLSISEITNSIGDFLDMAPEHPSGDARQHTVAATIDWSRRLLSPAAQDLLQKAAYFPNTWTLEAAQAVCAPPEQPKLRTRDLVRELLNHSLLFSSRTSRDEVRFGLLQTTRQVISKEMHGDRDLDDRYVAYCRQIVERAESLILSGEESKAHDLVDLEWEALIKALDLSYESSPNQCAAIALSLKAFWMRGLRIPEGKTWLERLSGCEDLGQSTRVSVRIALSTLYIWLGELEQAEKLLLKAEEDVRPSGGFDLATVIHNLAVVKDHMGKYLDAKMGFEQCALLFGECGRPAEEAAAFLNLGVTKLRLEEPLEECEVLFKQALQYAQVAGPASMEARAYSSLGSVEMKAGRIDEALRYDGLALRLWRDDPYIPSCAPTMINLAEMFLGLEDFEKSTRAVLIAERLEEISQSPLQSLRRSKLNATREMARNQVTPNDWRTAQRTTRSKAAQELITMAIQMIDEHLQTTE